MADALVDPDTLIETTEYSELLQKEVELKLVRSSSTFMYGAVRELDPGDVAWERDLETAFQAYYQYWDKNPKVANDIVKQFIKKLSPAGIGNIECKKDPEPLKESTLKPISKCVKGPPDSGGDVDLYELIQLSRYPGFNELLGLKLQELKSGPLKKEIDAFQAKKDRLRDEMLSFLKKKAEGNGRCFTPYWFVLTKFKRDDWGVTRIKPFPAACESHKQMLHEVVVKPMTETKPAPDKVLQWELVLKGHVFRHMDTLMVRYSSNCIMGALHENLNALKKRPKEDQLKRRLFLKMETNEEIARAFIQYFTTHAPDFATG